MLPQLEFAVQTVYLGNSHYQGEQSWNANSGLRCTTLSASSPRTSDKNRSPISLGYSLPSCSGPPCTIGLFPGPAQCATGPRPNSALCESVLSRRLDGLAVAALLRALEQYLRDHQQRGLLAFLDGKPLTVSGVSQDKDAGFGRMVMRYRSVAVWVRCRRGCGVGSGCGAGSGPSS